MQAVRSSEAQVKAVCREAPPLKVRGRFLTAVVVPVVGPADGTFVGDLDRMLEQSPHFLVNAPLVLDLERADGLATKGAFAALLSMLRDRRLTPIGIEGGQGDQQAAAAAHGLPQLSAGRETPLERRPRAVAPPPPAPAQGQAGRLITEPVRSGQRVMADGDLVVMAPVSSGAELIAEGHIHVHGALRGRALAGVSGDTSARIFCQSLEAELIAIAGLYKTSDDLDPAYAKRRVQVRLEDETLRIDALK